MKAQIKFFGVIAIAMVLFTSCDSKNNNKTGRLAEKHTTSTNVAEHPRPQKGQHVPNNLVCMVNDAYMGKAQIEVPFEGKTYYGCCNMCKERIPKEEKVRFATDPYSLKNISKADAYIVLIGDNDEVAYFESKANYQQFLKERY